jgi:type IV pilus assembly protein PilP
MNKVGMLSVFSILSINFIINTMCLSQVNAQDAVTEVAGKASGEVYFYNAEGRTDPFKPFVSLKSSSTGIPDPNEIVDESNSLSGMQLFEPGQLTLVGIINSSREPLALVEDQTKKGYILKMGNLIGKRGVVSSIDNQQVIITETAKTRSGKELKTTTAMRLKKEGDE